MNVSVERVVNDATLKITLPAEEVNKGFKKAISKIANSVNIPGFRKGKAPRNIIEMHYGKDAIKQEAFEIVANDCYTKALDQESLIPVSDPKVEESVFEENKDMELTIKVTSIKLTSNTTIYAKWTAKSDMSFTDVADKAYYRDAVEWAVGNGITKGTTATTFSPNATCTRAQAVTFLWRTAGSPEPETRTMPFTDVPAGSYYYDAVLWAVENGITKGTSDTTFSPNITCSRAQIVAFLWRSEKSPAAGTANPFADVKSDAYYADAVLWAVKENITKGTTSTTFSPNADCTRAQIVTFLWRCKK